jgi:aminobenzoyl-glutamate utilization protein B
MKKLIYPTLFLFAISFSTIAWGQAPPGDQNIEALKKEVIEKVSKRAKMAQVMLDKVFSFAELGFQETESSKYLTDILKEHGFKVEFGISGVPTAWWAVWGSGKPVIA